MEDISQVFDDMMGCGPLSFQELQEPMQVNDHPAPAPYSYENISFNQQQILDGVSFGVDSMERFDQPVIFLDGNKDESMDDFPEKIQCPNGRGDQSRLSETGMEKVWQRIRWTDDMVKVLITALSYVGDVASDGPESEMSQLLARVKGKWRSISNTMIERGYIVSPQQCEDKFNDLNKKYKKLNDLLGRSSSCDVVENPSQIEFMNIPDEAKEEVWKILNCKQLFYKELSSYHNNNRKFLPHDVPLQQLVHSALKGKIKYGFQNPTNVLSEGILSEGIQGQQEPSQWMISCSLQLAEKKFQIQNQRIELEKKKFEWLTFCQLEDKELHKMKLGNEFMKLENERLAFKLKCREGGYAPH